MVRYFNTCTEHYIVYIIYTFTIFYNTRFCRGHLTLTFCFLFQISNNLLNIHIKYMTNKMLFLFFNLTFEINKIKVNIIIMFIYIRTIIYDFDDFELDIFAINFFFSYNFTIFNLIFQWWVTIHVYIIIHLKLY